MLAIEPVSDRDKLFVPSLIACLVASDEQEDVRSTSIPAEFSGVDPEPPRERGAGDRREPRARSGVRVETFRADLREPAAIEALAAGALTAPRSPSSSSSPRTGTRCSPRRGPAGPGALRAGRRTRDGRAAARLAPYCASKAGLVQLTRVRALELARHHGQVNCVCPGYFATPMNAAFFGTAAGQAVIARAIPMRRLGDPAELGPTIVFLASDASSFMTGAVLTVDGGQSLT